MLVVGFAFLSYLYLCITMATRSFSFLVAQVISAALPWLPGVLHSNMGDEDRTGRANSHNLTQHALQEWQTGPVTQRRVSIPAHTLVQLGVKMFLHLQQDSKNAVALG